MKKSIFKKIWAAVCTVWVGMTGTLVAFATEQTTQTPSGAERVTMTMDVLQKVSLIIVIAVAVLIFAFYLAKMVLKKMYVAPEENEEKTIDQAKEE